MSMMIQIAENNGGLEINSKNDTKCETCIWAEKNAKPITEQKVKGNTITTVRMTGSGIRCKCPNIRSLIFNDGVMICSEYQEEKS